MDEPFDTHNRCHLRGQSVAAQARGLGWLVAWLSGWLTCVLAGPLTAQVYDAYEGGSPRWRLVESDSQAQVTLQEISPSMPRSGQTSELVELLCTNGTFAYLAIPIEPATIIDELAPSVWVQCMSGRIRLGANVVFPNAPHPVTGGRLHAILWGDTYDSPGQWQRLALTNCVKQLSQETIALRQRYGPKLDLEGAYIDSLVLNAYTGPGRYRIKIDDLSLQGAVSIASLGQMVPADWRSEWRWRDGSVHDEQRWLQGNNWRVPVWWQYQGESLPWLHALGFRGVLLNRFPTPELLQEIRSARLAVISPPPTTALTSEDKAWDTVQGWMVGAALDGRSLDQLRAETNRVEQFPEALRRATIAEALEEYWAFSRAVDELVIPAPSPLSAGTAVEKSQWLVQSLQNASKRSSGWVSVTTDALPSWAAQVETARKWVEPGSTELELVDAGQLRLQVARSVAAGSRGFLFRSSVPLDISHVDHQVRVAAMRTINRDLEFMSPWISNGQTAPIPKLDRADFDAAAWTASRSLLVMLINNTPENQHCLPPTRQTPLRATMPLPSGIKNVLRITSGVPQSLLLQPSTEGMSWEIRDPGAIELCVLTDNPVVERYVTRLTSQSADEYAEDCLDIASHQLQLASRVTSVRWPDVADELPRRYLSTVAAGQQRVDQGYQELRARRPGRAVEAAAQAYDAAQMIIFESYQTAISNLAAPQASPFVLNPATLPYHWLLAQSCARSSWRSVPLPGNELQSLDSMLQAGWSQQRRQTTRAEMLVELVPASTNNSPGLRLAALAKTAGGLPGGYEGATVRVRSAAAQVNKGELLRLTARATVRRAPQQPGAGLLVYDNYAGPALGQLVRGTTGETIAIELYRFATDETPLRLLTELRGECDIVIDNIAVSAIQPAINASNYPTNYKYIPTNPPDSSLDR